jgi:hypothetical protein
MSIVNDPEPVCRDPENPTRDELRALGLWRLRHPGLLGAEPPFTLEEQELAQQACYRVARERAKSKR